MALVTCHECKKEVSSEAAVCPHCGAKPKAGFGAGSVVLVAFVGVVAYTCAGGPATVSSSAPAPAAKVKTASEIRADEEINLAIAAGRVLKTHAKDPASFKMESFLIFPGGATCFEYRAKNSFGAVVPAKAVFTPPGKMLTSEANGNSFVKAWNATCTKAGGAERAGGLNLLGVF